MDFTNMNIVGTIDCFLRSENRVFSMYMLLFNSELLSENMYTVHVCFANQSFRLRPVRKRRELFRLRVRSFCKTTFARQRNDLQHVSETTYNMKAKRLTTRQRNYSRRKRTGSRRNDRSPYELPIPGVQIVEYGAVSLPRPSPFFLLTSLCLVAIF